MSQRIFTNGEEGKILTSVGNRIVKQPYEFGNAFQNRMGLNNYISINASGITRYFNTLQWIKWTENTGGSVIAFVNFNNTNNDNYAQYIYNFGGGYRFVGKNNSSATQANMSLYYSPPMPTYSLNSLILRNTQINTWKLDNTTTTASTSQTNDYDLSNIWLLASRNSNGTIPTSFDTLGLFLISRFVLFNRELSNSEYSYYFNNKTGNELQSSAGVEIDIHCDFAEVINILGVDQPCVRDYSGNNRHGIIMNLPAGTAQQKVDYANANLFVPFI